MEMIAVAGMKLRIQSADEAFFQKRFAEYRCEDGQPDMIMETWLRETLSKPAGELYKQMQEAYACRLSDSENCYYRCHPQTGEVLLTIRYRTDYSRVVMEIKKGARLMSLQETELEYLYTGFLFANRLTVLGGTVLHGSAIACDGRGLVFTADPGTGKSTHTGLWKQKLGDRVTVINDDKPAIRFLDGKPWLFGTPWSGKSDLNRNVQVPLEAVVCLKRGKENTVAPMALMGGLLYLSTQMPNPFYDTQIGKKTGAFISRLYSAGLPIYELHCTVEEQAVDTVYEEIFGKEDAQ